MTSSKPPKYRYRSAVTGRFVTQLYALANERETYRVLAKPKRRVLQEAPQEPAPASTES